MTKWRSRKIVEAVQWFPGKEIEGVLETKDGRGVFLKDSGTLFWGNPLVEPGDYIFFTKDGYRYHRKRAEFEAEYENIGG